MIPDASITVIPTTSDLYTSLQTSKTYKISSSKIQGSIDGIDALQQTIDKILNTEQYEYPIYNFSYGIEMESLFGKDKLYAQMELERRIKECLMMDERIQNVENFSFTINGASLICTFDVKSIYGTTTLTKEVNV